MKSCFQSTQILLPRHDIAMENWSVVACDQFTSEEEYWKEVENQVQDQPSALHLIFPEVYLGKDPERITRINQTMADYLQNHILEKRIDNGFVLVERTVNDQIRLGFVGVIDLEAYDFTPGSSSLIRATEGTIQSRIPPRLKIRENALLECPHVMVLIDDPKMQLIEPLYNNKDHFECLYDFELMQNGGHLRGYAITGQFADAVNAKLALMESESNGFFLAVGDGNHSLATAKAYWENIKKTLNENQMADHPARYAMVELVNLHSPALVFEPIHRLLFNVDMNDLLVRFKEYVHELNIQLDHGEDLIFINDSQKISFQLLNTHDRLAVDILQTFLDEYLNQHPQTQIDYIHGLDTIQKLSQHPNSCGIILPAIDKKTLFPAIAAGGVLPRKTFSMGEANEKRYYVECRRITQ